VRSSAASTDRARLIERYLPLAHTIAARLYRMRKDDSVAFNDYLQYARLGLIESIDRYDPTREASFATFSSYRIRGAILNGLATETELAAQTHFRRAQWRDRMESLTSRESSDADVELRELASLTVGLALGFMLDQAREPIDEATQSNPYAATELAELRRVVRDIVLKLPDRERRLIEKHYYTHEEFQAIAVEWGITKGRVSQLHAQALARIRTLLSAPPTIDREA